MQVLIGRERELKTLEKALHSACEGIGCCILLRGEAGIGKSRLIEELRHKATSEKITILQGDCFEPDISFPYAPWIDALRAFFGPLNAADLEALLGPLAPEFVKILPELALLLPQLQPTPPLEPLAEKHRLFESFARFGSSLSRANPVLLILEDLHWSDVLSLELLRYFIHRMHNQPLMLVGSYRIEGMSPHMARHLSRLDREPLTQEIALNPLDHAEVEQMTRVLLKTQHHIPPTMIATLWALTNGNPFFVEEVVKSLAEEARINQPMRYESLDELRVPRSIQRMVQARVEHLAPGTRRILIHASVIGQRFHFGLLQEITIQDEQELLQALKELMDAYLVVQESADRFAFKHALTRDAVRSMLTLREQKVLHQRIGQVLERSYGRGSDPQVSELAYHFFQAESWQKALEYAQRAGANAQALYAPREAVAFFTQAIQAAQHLSLEPASAILRGRAQAYEASSEFDLALKDYEAELQSAMRTADRSAEWQARIDLGLLWQSRELERAGEYYREALDLARILGDLSFLAKSLNRVGNWHMNRGQARQALSFHGDALELFRRLDDQRGIAHTMELLGMVSYALGDAIQGAAYLQQAVPILRELDDRQGLVNTLTNLTMRARMETEVLGDIDYLRLTAPSDEALQMARGFNWYQGEVLALMQGAISLQQAGAYGQALERVSRAQFILEESQDRESVARTHLISGKIFMEMLAFAEAQQHLETGLAMVKELGSGLLVPGAIASLASTAILQGHFARAHALLAGLLPAEYPQGEESFPQRLCWSARAELEVAQGFPHRALEIIDRLLGSTTNLTQFGPHAVPLFSRLRGRALAALGRLAEAEAEFQGTLPVVVRQRQPPMQWRLHADLGKVYRAMSRRADAEREFSSARAIIGNLAYHVPEGGLRQNFLRQAMATIPAAHVPTRRQAAKQEFGGLTAREREIAALIARGKSNREIANELVVSEKTTERHIANILKKLDFSSRTQIAVWSVEKGLHR